MLHIENNYAKYKFFFHIISNVSILPVQVQNC